MTPLETRIRDALRASAELPVSLQDIERAQARFRTRQALPTRRPGVEPALPAVALAVAAVLAVAAGLVWWLGRPGTGGDIEPAPPAPRPTQSSATDGRVGLIDLPPQGLAPTGTATGQLVASAGGWEDPTWVFADGRIITLERDVTNDHAIGYLVRRLTHSGVEAMRSYILDHTAKLTPPAQTGAGPEVLDGGRIMIAKSFEDCDQWDCPALENPETWLPATAWADPTFRPFVPYDYQVCMRLPEAGAPELLLPPEVADVLPAAPTAEWEYCAVVPTSRARDLAGIMDGAGPGYDRLEDPAGLAYHVPLPDPRESGSLAFEAVLPHGGSFCMQCG
jgi:hypothetical protein